MRGIRRHLCRIVGLWLVAQLGIVTTAPVLLASGLITEDDGVFCTCASLGPGHFCPMHGSQPHHPDGHTDAEQELSDCALSSGAPASTTTLSSLLGAVGLAPLAQGFHARLALAEPIATATDVAIARPHLPDSPPPRITAAR